MALLEIDNLQVYYKTSRGWVHAVDGVCMKAEKAQTVALIGESGCGKSTFARGIVRVLASNAAIKGGSVRFDGRDLLAQSEREMRAVRWRRIAFIPQASLDSLNPVRRVGKQIVEILTVRGGLSRSAASARSQELAEQVGLKASALRSFPHELSGGMKQRAVIAMALALRPAILIADEPVTALDVIVQRQILQILQRLREELSLTVLLITHDVSVVAEMADVVQVMYAGQCVEEAPSQQFFNSASHPYSLGLLNAVPSVRDSASRPITIAGYPPDLLSSPDACRFAPRCPFVESECQEAQVPLREITAGHKAACLRSEDVVQIRAEAAKPEVWLQERIDSGAHLRQTAAVPLIEVKNLTKVYETSGSLRLLGGGRTEAVKAVNGISFSVGEGESLGLAGESGCGKTTTGKVLTKLLEPSGGSIVFDGQRLEGLGGAELLNFRRRVQLMFQNPFEALNPRFALYRSLAEPLKIHGWSSEADRKARIVGTLERVRLSANDAFFDAFPHQLSGGQLQRATLARALVLEPDFLVADEPVSMLDISVRAGILNTMKSLVDEMGLSTLYISHDLSLFRYACERIAIMFQGHIVELGPAHSILREPRHPYTLALMAAVPDMEARNRNRPQPAVQVSNLTLESIEQGCPFYARCPVAEAICRESMPPEVTIDDGHTVLCYLYT